MFNWLSIKRIPGHNPAGILAMAVGLLLAVQCTGFVSPVQAASVEYRVKAAFLFNFTKFVDWPPGDQHPAQAFIIGILGDDPFGDDIQRLAGKTVGDRNLSIRRYPAWDDAAATCDILFIAASQKDDLETILDRLGGTPVLTVGDSTDFARRGVMINFFMDANKVRFEVNLKRASQAGFKISSRLLKLATIVDDR